MNIGIIGIGKIATALVEGLCTSSMENLSVFLSPRNEANSIKLSGLFTNVYRLPNNQEVIDRSDVIIITLPVSTVKGILDTLSFEKRHKVISVVALLKYEDLAPRVSPASIICRAIPLPSVKFHRCPIPIFKAD